MAIKRLQHLTFTNYFTTFKKYNKVWYFEWMLYMVWDLTWHEISNHISWKIKRNLLFSDNIFYNGFLRRCESYLFYFRIGWYLNKKTCQNQCQNPLITATRAVFATLFSGLPHKYSFYRINWILNSQMWFRDISAPNKLGPWQTRPLTNSAPIYLGTKLDPYKLGPNQNMVQEAG